MEVWNIALVCVEYSGEIQKEESSLWDLPDFFLHVGRGLRHSPSIEDNHLRDFLHFANRYPVHGTGSRNDRT
jgi:hypothetical protein